MANADTDLAAENAALRKRVDELEAEVADLRQRTATTLARAQDSLYWFDRWGVDFNSLMSRPAAEYVRKTLRGLRSVYRSGLRVKRKISP
jgi:hypothetical protein